MNLILRWAAIAITSIAAGLLWVAILAVCVLSSGCSADVNIKEQYLPPKQEPCKNSLLVKDWVAPRQGYATALFRADCTYVSHTFDRTVRIEGTYRDLNPGSLEGIVVMRMYGYDFGIRYKINEDMTLLELF
jgi:hypothetical protein